MKQRLLAVAAAAGIAFAVPQVEAHTVDLTGFTYANPTVATVQSTSASSPISPFAVYAGQYSGLLDGRAFVSYCVELTQSLRFDTLYTDFQIVSGVDAWGAAKSAQFDRLISFLFSTNVVTNANASGLAQSAVWETLYETSPSNGFATGTFRATSANPMMSAANTVDWSFLNSVPITYHVDLLHSPTAQDLMLIRAAAVPEPSAIALWLAGALGLFAAARRRRTTTAMPLRAALQ